ncbi:Elongation factor 1-gamma like protein [Argiope bruennichi]|uniref:Elongation factor 1-gamma n=1 Tax=Argiope bruennichi TaxID=94029 RepID=A0A8T0EG21_ARGBR|nr:Elongation factor 1-gamma like protein [Argiope bruennichi]
MACTLYTYPNNFRAQKALIAAQYSGTAVNVPEDFSLGETNKTAEFLKKFPNGKVPALETPDKKYLSESNAIAFYVGNDELNGKTQFEKAQILMWMNFADSEILPPSCTWVFPCLGLVQFNKQSTEKAKEDVKRILQILNDHLLHSTYLVGERITQADISVVCNLLSLYQLVLEPSFRQPYRCVNRWFKTCINQPQFKAVLGDVVLCEKMAQFDAKKFADVQKELGQGKPAKGKEVAAATPKDNKKKKQEPKPKKEEVAAEEPDETELALAQEPKSKDPFEKFPKGTFNMDEFKRTYSNEDESVSIKYFWDKFDAENYSIWYCEYLFPQELTLTFMSCNLIGGMFQRLDKMRKNAFASVCLFGEDNNSTISGIWVWRGHELAFTLSEDWQIDYESYSWKKLDPSSPETKKIVNEYLSWSGDFGGKKFNQGKIFK